MRNDITTTIQTPAALEAFTGSFLSFVDRTEETHKTYITNLRQFFAYLKWSGTAEPTRDDIIRYRDWLLSEHQAIILDEENPCGWSYRYDKAGNIQTVACKASTVRVYLESVKQFFKWLEAENLYRNVTKGVNSPKVNKDHKKDALTAEEVLTIEESIKAAAADKQEEASRNHKDTAGRIERATEQGKRLYAMYLLAVNAGLRTIELHRANIKDLQTRNGQTVLYIYGKGRSEADQKKPVAPEVYEAIKDYLDSRTDNPTGTSPLFVSTGNRSKGQRIATTTISTMLKKAMQTAGFNSERLTAHSLRHTAGTNTMQVTGNNIYLTQHYMRHQSPTTTEIYLHADTEAQDATIAGQLYNHYHGIEKDDRSQIEALLQTMNPEQLAQLKGIAAAMAQ